MVVDASALVAILRAEPDADVFARAIERDSKRLISTVTALETSIVIENLSAAAGVRDLDLMLYRMGAQMVHFTVEHLEVARIAFRRFGKGRHPAGLNFGACCTYALAKVSGEALLAKGNDFPRTDLRIVELG